MKLAIAVLTISFAIPTFGQSDVLSEAKANIMKKQHEALVAQAESLLERKRKLEAKLAKVTKDLDDTNNGKLIKPKAASTVAYTNGNISGYYQCPSTNSSEDDE